MACPALSLSLVWAGPRSAEYCSAVTATRGPCAARVDHLGWQECSHSIVGNGLKNAKLCGVAHRSHCQARRLQAVRLQVSPLERWWRYLWRRKGDVYHLMFDMCRFLDGRLWPSQDKTDVQLFLQLMKHVTGEVSAAACCVLAPSAALPSWPVMAATADGGRDR